MQRTQIRDSLRQIFEQEMDSTLEHLRDDMVLAEEFDLDSVDYVSLIMRVEESFHIRMTNGELSNATTIGTLVDLVEAKVAASPTPQTARRAA
jgi:acyl carrier protein